MVAKRVVWKEGVQKSLRMAAFLYRESVRAAYGSERYVKPSPPLEDGLAGHLLINQQLQKLGDGRKLAAILIHAFLQEEVLPEVSALETEQVGRELLPGIRFEGDGEGGIQELHGPEIFVSQRPLFSPLPLVSLMKGERPLLLIAPEVGDEVVAALAMSNILHAVVRVEGDWSAVQSFHGRSIYKAYLEGGEVTLLEKAASDAALSEGYLCGGGVALARAGIATDPQKILHSNGYREERLDSYCTIRRAVSAALKVVETIERSGAILEEVIL